MKKEAVFSVKAPSGQIRVTLPLDSLSVDSLKIAIEKAAGIAPLQQELRFGYPPQLLGSDAALPSGGSVTVSVLAALPGKKVVRRVVPANNSCLFACFAYCLMNRSRTLESARRMRAVVQQVRFVFPVIVFFFFFLFHFILGN